MFRSPISFVIFASVLLGFSGWANTRRAWGAACCMSATSFGVGRLLIWEDAAVGLQLEHARSLGTWDGHGTLLHNPPGYSEGVTRLEPWGILRLHERLQLQARVPVLYNDRETSDHSQIAGGLADVSVGVRIEVVSLGAFAGLPSLAFTSLLIFPTGRTADQTTPPLFAGTTGRRTWGGGLSLESEYAFLPWFLRLDAAATGFASSMQAGHRRQPGLLMAAALSAGRELGSGKAVLALAFSQEWQRPLHQDGVSVADSRAHLSVLALSLALRIAPHWTVVTGVSNSFWPDGMGRNRDARVGLNSGIRYGHF